MPKFRPGPRPKSSPAPVSAQPVPAPRFRPVWILLGLALFTLLLYSPVRNFDFLNFDDPDYIAHNPHVLAGLTPASLTWAFTSTATANWFPLTWISYMLDVQLFGAEPAAPHLTNVFLHTGAALFLFAFLRRATGALWRSAFVAFVFACHPLHVESVAWVAERKDVLSAFFCFLTLWLYVRYAEKPDALRYLLTLLAFALGLMAKPMIVTLPFVLLLLDGWPLARRNWPMLLREKIAFVALSAVLSYVTFAVQQSTGAVKSLTAIPLNQRIGNALVSYVIYLAKTICPVDLAAFYPFPHDLPIWQPVLAALALIALSVTVWRGRQRFPYLAAGWFWFAGTLVPVIGLVQVGGQARADRYMYIPMVGLLIMLTWGAADLLRHSPRTLTALTVLVCVGCPLLASVQIDSWRNSVTLFEHALAVTSDNDFAEHNLGSALLDSPARLPEAVAHLEAALRINPSPETRSDLANALARIPGRLPEAIAQFQSALQALPDSAILHNNLASALAQAGHLPEAITEYDIALKLDPEYPQLRLNLAVAHANLASQLTDPIQAVAHYEIALKLNPDLAEAHYNLGITLSSLPGRLPDAESQLETAVRLNPNYAEAHNNLGTLLARMGRPSEAVPHFEAAIRLHPDYADAHYNLGVALSQIPARRAEAAAHLEAAERLSHQHP